MASSVPLHRASASGKTALVLRQLVFTSAKTSPLLPRNQPSIAEYWSLCEDASYSPALLWRPWLTDIDCQHV